MYSNKLILSIPLRNKPIKHGFIKGYLKKKTLCIENQ